MRSKMAALAFAIALLGVAATPALAFPGDGPGPGAPVADPNGDCRNDLSDAVIVLMHQFQGDPSDPLVTVICGDCNDSDSNLADPIFTLNQMFAGVPAPDPAADHPDTFIEVSCSDLGP